MARLLVLMLVAFAIAIGAQAKEHARVAYSDSTPAQRKSHAVRSPYGQDGSDYVLSFADEFSHLDRSLWNDHLWYEQSNSTVNYAVDDGMLRIWPQRDESGRFFNRTLDTDGHFSQRYGYFEMEAKLPRGKGTWPAFWLFAHPGERRPEIDIMEAYPGGIAPWGHTDADGIARPTAYAPTVWLDKGVHAGSRQFDTHADLSLKFHKYAVKWEPHKLTFYFDGKKVYVAHVSISDPMFIVLDLWFGSDSGQPDESTPEGELNAYQIKYVRAWRFR